MHSTGFMHGSILETRDGRLTAAIGAKSISPIYQTMKLKYPDKVIVGGAWSTFDDRSFVGMNRHISGRCGQTFKQTFDYWRKFFSPDWTRPLHIGRDLE